MAALVNRNLQIATLTASFAGISQKNRGMKSQLAAIQSASRKAHPSKPHPCNMPPAQTEVALPFQKVSLRSCSGIFAFLHCGCHFYQKAALQHTKKCLATSNKLRCKKVALICRFPVDLRLPRLGSHVFGSCCFEIAISKSLCFLSLKQQRRCSTFHSTYKRVGLTGALLCAGMPAQTTSSQKNVLRLHGYYQSHIERLCIKEQTLPKETRPQGGRGMDAAFLLIVRSFLLTVELFTCNCAF